jgi:putative type II/III system pilus formation protein
MTAFVTGRGHRPLMLPVLGSVAVAFAAVIPPKPAIAAEPVTESVMSAPVTVRLDQAKLFKLPERTTTLVIGNPLIADASVQPGGVAVVTAKSYGMTNLVALDRTGATLAEYPIQVIGPGDAIVVIYRGVERESYSCAPVCEKRITLGDSAPIFGANLTALGTFNSQMNPEQKK